MPAVWATLPSAKVMAASRVGQRCVVVSSYPKSWPCLFPQSGPGRKHRRPIVLTAWQQVAAAHHPVELLRGLHESDGCRSVNTVRTASRTYEYPRYFFRNASEDILGLFGDRLGVAWTRSAARTISVSRRTAVARLDEWLGPKR